MYNKLKRYFEFLTHRYKIESFAPRHIKSNLKMLISTEEGQALYTNGEGKLQTTHHPVFFKVLNIISLGALQSRLNKVLYFTFMAYTLEFNNPFDKEVLNLFITRKVRFLTTLAEKIKTLGWDEHYSQLADLQIQRFERSSLMQLRVIQMMRRALKKQSTPLVIQEGYQGIKKGYYPLLVIQGLSGAYWIRNDKREIIGLFKPFDEECFAPHNPIGPSHRGALGLRKMRSSIRVGENVHREVAAFCVDEFFELGIVPKTYYATFAHHVFCLAGVARDKGGVKTKMGSFQEYIEGFCTLADLQRQEWAHIPEIEVQLLIVLDVILGNSDRNASNILVGEEKIAAIDHGLCLPDINFGLSTWYWKALDQGKKVLYPALVELLEDFPFAPLCARLKARCMIDERALARLRERVVLFREGVRAGRVPHDLADLMTDENLFALKDLSETLEGKARELIHRPD